MHQDGNVIGRARLPASQEDASSDQGEGNAWTGDRPSSRLTDEEWRAIVDSLDLSVRQLEIVQCVFDGFDEPSIGKELGASVHAHANRLYKKIRVKSRCELIVRVFLGHLPQTSAGTLPTCPLASRPTCAPAFRTTRGSDRQLAVARM